MSGVNERVKQFLESWKHIANIENAVCSCCGVELIDGNFAVVDGELLCLRCVRR